MWPFVTCFTKGFLKKSLTYFITEEESIIKVCLTVALNPMAFFFFLKKILVCGEEKLTSLGVEIFT